MGALIRRWRVEKNQRDCIEDTIVVGWTLGSTGCLGIDFERDSQHLAGSKGSSGTMAGVLKRKL